MDIVADGSFRSCGASSPAQLFFLGHRNSISHVRTSPLAWISEYKDMGAKSQPTYKWKKKSVAIVSHRIWGDCPCRVAQGRLTALGNCLYFLDSKQPEVKECGYLIHPHTSFWISTQQWHSSLSMVQWIIHGCVPLAFFHIKLNINFSMVQIGYIFTKHYASPTIFLSTT